MDAQANVDDYEGEGHVPRNGGQAFCARSLSDDDSAYVDHGCDPAFDEYMRYPTTLEIDCRCRITSKNAKTVHTVATSASSTHLKHLFSV